MERDLKHKIPDLKTVVKKLVKQKEVLSTKKGNPSKIHYYLNTDVLGELKDLGLWSPSRQHKLP